MCNTYLCVQPVLGRCWTSGASRGRWPPRASSKDHDLLLPSYQHISSLLLFGFWYFVVVAKPPVVSWLLLPYNCSWTFYSSGSSGSTWGAWRVRPEGKNPILMEDYLNISPPHYFITSVLRPMQYQEMLRKVHSCKYLHTSLLFLSTVYMSMPDFAAHIDMAELSRLVNISLNCGGRTNLFDWLILLVNWKLKWQRKVAIYHSFFYLCIWHLDLYGKSELWWNHEFITFYGKTVSGTFMMGCQHLRQYSSVCIQSCPVSPMADVQTNHGPIPYTSPYPT